MSFLFEINGRQVWPRAETLLVSPFREIWERDKSKDKEDALGELAFIEFCTSAKRSNPFGQYPDSVREEVVAGEVVRREGWRPDGLVREGMEKVRRMQEEGSDAYRYYLSARAAVELPVAAFLGFDEPTVPFQHFYDLFYFQPFHRQCPGMPAKVGNGSLFPPFALLVANLRRLSRKGKVLAKFPAWTTQGTLRACG